MATNPIQQPSAVVVPPETGDSYWQPLPARGYVTVNLSPTNMPFDTFTSGIQVLPPGCYVRDHGHKQNHELIFVYEGRGEVRIDDDVYPVEQGSTVLFGRYAVHRITNTGEQDLKLFWVFFPPGLEDWFRAIGRPRSPGAPTPPPFPRPDGVEPIQERMRFVVPGPSPSR